MITPILLTTYVLLTIGVFVKLAVIKTDISNLKGIIEKDDKKNTDAHAAIWDKNDEHTRQISENKSGIANIFGKVNGGKNG